LRPVFLYMGQEEFWIDKLISHYMVYVVSKSTKFGVCNCWCENHNKYFGFPIYTAHTIF